MSACGLGASTCPGARAPVHMSQHNAAMCGGSQQRAGLACCAMHVLPQAYARSRSALSTQNRHAIQGCRQVALCLHAPVMAHAQHRRCVQLRCRAMPSICLHKDQQMGSLYIATRMM